jgi:hypothetical protein
MMPEPKDLKRVKSIEQKSGVEYMRPGISFLNPPFIRPATIVKDYPWIMMRWSTPYTVVRKGIPHNVWSNKRLNTRRGYWRKTAKNETMLRLNHGGQEVDSFDDMGLGETPDNKNATPLHEKNMWGVVTSMLTQAGTIWQRREAGKVEVEIAKAQIRADSIRAEREGFLTTGTVTAIGVGAFVLGLYFLSIKPSVTRF